MLKTRPWFCTILTLIFRLNDTSFQLRVMLDRESRNDDAAVQWSDDGNSFFVTDQTQFEEVSIVDR